MPLEMQCDYNFYIKEAHMFSVPCPALPCHAMPCPAPPRPALPEELDTNFAKSNFRRAAHNT